MKFFSFSCISICLALVTGWPLVLLLGASRRVVVLLSLIGSAIAPYRPRQHALPPAAYTGEPL